MNFSKLNWTVMVALGASLVQAAPVVRTDSVTMQQDASRMVTIDYTLDEEPGIITLDILTNDVSIGHANIQCLAGDVNMKVETGSRRILWRPDKSWPGFKFTNNEVKAVVRAWSTNTPPDYMAVDLTMPKTRFFYPSAEAVPGGVTNDLYRTSMMLMRRIPAANVRWRMGSPANEQKRDANRETLHYVTLTEDYYMGVFELTQRQCAWIRGSVGGCQFVGDTLPVDGVTYRGLRDLKTGPDTNSWESVHHVEDGGCCADLRNLTGLQFDLPTDAQWEFAYRAGESAAYHNGSNSSCDDIAWTDANSGGTTHVVGTKAPNAWGIYDMAGNVWEWCIDEFNANASVPYPEGSAIIDPVGGNTGIRGGTIRGGSWQNTANLSRAAFRETFDRDTVFHTIGARFVCPAVVP